MRHPFLRLDDVRANIMVFKTGILNSYNEDIDFIAFPVSHDAAYTVGYFIRFTDLNFLIITDLGYVPKEAMIYSQQSHILVVESNYDVDMLIKGSYPHELKCRVMGEHGHLSNEQCSDFLEAVLNGKQRAIFLAHISNNNNTPNLALESAKRAITKCGYKVDNDILLRALDRDNPTELFTF